jgi:uncharacterized protein (DUF1778 family)
MPRAATDGGRIELRLRPEDKAILSRAAALRQLDLTGYILHTVLPQAQADIREAERLTLSERDSLRILELLETRHRHPSVIRQTSMIRTKTIKDYRFSTTYGDHCSFRYLQIHNGMRSRLLLTVNLMSFMFCLIHHLCQPMIETSCCW